MLHLEGESRCSRHARPRATTKWCQWSWAASKDTADDVASGVTSKLTAGLMFPRELTKLHSLSFLAVSLLRAIRSSILGSRTVTSTVIRANLPNSFKENCSCLKTVSLITILLCLLRGTRRRPLGHQRKLGVALVVRTAARASSAWETD